MQTLETLRLRLTTNVTVSPASSARSSSAAARIASIASGRVSANIAVSSSGVTHPPSRARSIAGPTSSERIANGGPVPPPPPPRGEAPARGLDDVEHALGHPLGVHVLRVGAQAFGQRDAVRGEPLAHLMR